MSERMVRDNHGRTTSYVDRSSTTMGETVLAIFPAMPRADRHGDRRAFGLGADGRVLDEGGAGSVDQQQGGGVRVEDLADLPQQLVGELVDAEPSEGRVGDRLDSRQTPGGSGQTSLRVEPLGHVLEARHGTFDAGTARAAIGAESTEIVTVEPSAPAPSSSRR